jgi:hypothetical protein
MPDCVAWLQNSGISSALDQVNSTVEDTVEQVSGAFKGLSEGVTGSLEDSSAALGRGVEAQLENLADAQRAASEQLGHAVPLELREQVMEVSIFIPV